MPIKRVFQHQITIAALVIGCMPSAYADNAVENSPYRLSSKPIKIPSTPAKQSGNPQAYQLEYRYRSPNLPAKLIKAEGQLIEPDANIAINEKLSHQPFFKEIALAATAASLDPALVHAVIYVESRYQHTAVSPKGAVGLMQVLPDTAARYGVSYDDRSPKANLKAGTLYLRDLMRIFDNRLELALAAYNAGEGAVMKHSWQVPPYRETRQYVIAVMAKYNEWRDMEPITANNEDKLAINAKPTNRVRTEYLTGTRLAVTEEVFLPSY